MTGNLSRFSSGNYCTYYRQTHFMTPVFRRPWPSLWPFSSWSLLRNFVGDLSLPSFIPLSISFLHRSSQKNKNSIFFSIIKDTTFLLGHPPFFYYVYFLSLDDFVIGTKSFLFTLIMCYLFNRDRSYLGYHWCLFCLLYSCLPHSSYSNLDHRRHTSSTEDKQSLKNILSFVPVVDYLISSYQTCKLLSSLRYFISSRTT